MELVHGLRALLAAHKWTTVFLIWEDRGDVAYYRAICRNFQTSEALRAEVEVISVIFNSASPATDFAGLLGQASAASRVTVVGSYPYLTTVPAIEAAAELVNRKYFPYLSVNISVLITPQFYDCDLYADNVANLAARNFYKRTLSTNAIQVFIGPTCVPEALNVATLMSGSVGTDSRLSNKRAFPTTITSSATHHTVLVQGFRALLATYNWTTLFLICDDHGDVSYYRAICRNLQIPQALGAAVRVKSVTFDSASSGINVGALLGQAAAASRVVFLSMQMPLTRRFLVHAKRSNMVTSDYVYICSWPGLSPSFPEMRWRMGDDNDTDDASEAFRQLFIVSFDSNRRLPQEDEIFTRRRSSIAYNYTYGETEQVLNESLSQGGGDLTDAQTLTRRFFNRTFTVPTGSVYINENGDRFPNLAVLHFDPQTESAEAVLKYEAATMVVSAVNDTVIRWISGQPPSGMPGKCGFDGKSCGDGGSLVDLWAALGTIIVLLFGVLTFRRVLEYATTLDRWWLLTEQDLVARIHNSIVYVY
ncbi:hypothetical protein BV898_20132 [Hypsibius exemplaris]|uniref:Receptor ligand binding region domain-containing protein n=1 Tax=Hypsibius exemplaris TaxID=2072580 RepID=A0A1W0XE12_HYPEX|nr:hypothetical protein BV898_20132 [Hypsibius exemplaris]